MADSSKFKLTNDRFEQQSGDTLTLSGNTIINGNLEFSSGYTPTGNTSVATKLYTDQNGINNLTFREGVTKDVDNNISLGGDILTNVTLNAVGNLSLEGDININNVETVYSEILPDSGTTPTDDYVQLAFNHNTIDNIRYNISVGYISDGGSFAPYIRILKEDFNTDSVTDFYFTNGQNPSGWTGSTLEGGGADVFVSDVVISSRYATVREIDFINGGQSDVLIIDLVNQTVDRLSSVIPQISNFTDPDSDRVLYPYLQVVPLDGDSNFYKVLFNDTSTNTIYVYSSFDDTTKSITGGDAITGDTTTLPNVVRASFKYDNVGELSNFLVVETTGNTLSDRFLEYNLTGDSVTFITMLDSGGTVIPALQSLGVDDLLDYKILFNIGYNVQVLTKNNHITIVSEIGAASGVAELPLVGFSDNSSRDNVYRINNFVAESTSNYTYTVTDGLEIYTVTIDIFPFNNIVSISKDFLYNTRESTNGGGSSNTSYVDGIVSRTNGTKVETFSYTNQAFDISTSQNGFIYPSTYTSAPLDGLITKRALSGQTINDYTSYVSGVTNIAGADAFNDLRLTVTGLTAQTSVDNLTFENGISRTSDTVSLGGVLTGDTVINTNNHGITFGSNSISCGNNSFAEGSQTTASGQSSHAEGSNTTASGNYGSHAEGYYTIASGNYGSHAEGSNTTASGGGSHAEGYSTLASGNGSHVEGFSTIACGFVSHAEGNSTIACGGGSHAEGCSTIASGYNSHAEGRDTTASGNYSHAGGRGIFNKDIFAEGCVSFNHSYNSGSQILGHGALANSSVILGGINHNIASGNTNAAIIGGNTIKLTGTTYVDTTAVGKLAIMSQPANGDASTTVMVRDSSTGIIQERSQADVASASDERLKNIIQPITGVLEGLSLLNSYEFQFKDIMKPESLKGKTRYGLIAQELEKVFPHVVENDYKIGDEIYKSVRYTELIPILVKAIQELREEINLLKK